MMEYGEHGSPFQLNDVEDEVREPRDDSSSDVAIDDWTCLRMFTDELQLLPQGTQVLLTEPRHL